MGPFQMMRAAAPHLRADGGGEVISISSVSGVAGVGSSLPYCASKAALNKYMKMAALEYVKEGVALCVIHPGWVQTDMGGPSADITAEQSAAGIIDVIDKLDMSNAGGFFKWDGDTHEW